MMSARQARDNRGAHKARALISNETFRDDTTSARPARASSGARQARAPVLKRCIGCPSRLYMSTVGYLAVWARDLIQFLAVMTEARTRPPLWFQMGPVMMTCQARPARASSGARQARAPRHGSTCQLSMAVYTGFNPISCSFEERAQGARCDFKWGLSWWHDKRAPSARLVRRAPCARASSRLYMSTVYGCIPDLIQFLAVLRSVHTATAVISNRAVHDDMTSARPARASSGARQARASCHGSTCQNCLWLYTGFNPISCCYGERAQGARCDFKWGLSWCHDKRAPSARQARSLSWKAL